MPFPLPWIARFEHSQNVILSKILSTCLDLTDGGGAKGADMPDQLGRSINLWLQLQNSVSGVMDSTAADTANDAKETPGIRQLLEKKEGLFRKNMMVKRVNFAAW